jgi:uncharacterized protein (DUF697 family)
MENQENQAVEQPTVDSQARLNQADNIVKNHVIASLAVGLIPIPLIDMAALTGIQLKMLHSLTKHYQVEFSNEIGKSVIASLLGGILATETAIPAASLLKIIPFVGQVSGMVSVSILGGAATYAIGQVFINHFESGGNLLNFQPEKMKEFVAEQYKKGKQVAADLKNKKPSPATQSPTTTSQN